MLINRFEIGHHSKNEALALQEPDWTYSNLCCSSVVHIDVEKIVHYNSKGSTNVFFNDEWCITNITYKGIGNFATEISVRI